MGCFEMRSINEPVKDLCYNCIKSKGCSETGGKPLKCVNGRQPKCAEELRHAMAMPIEIASRYGRCFS